MVFVNAEKENQMKYLDGQEPHRTSLEALFRCTTKYGSHCEKALETSSGALTTGSLNPAPDSGGSLFFKQINVSILRIVKNVTKKDVDE